jgi:hypothetical protein
MASVDPFVIQWPREWLQDAEIGPVVVYLNRFLHDLWVKTGGGDDSAGEAATENDIASGEHHRNLAIISVLERRVDVLEGSFQYDELKSQITAINRKINKMISDLIEEIQKLQPDIEAQTLQLTALENINRELKLMNVRIEEAYDTGYTKADL